MKNRLFLLCSGVLVLLTACVLLFSIITGGNSSDTEPAKAESKDSQIKAGEKNNDLIDSDEDQTESESDSLVEENKDEQQQEPEKEEDAKEEPVVIEVSTKYVSVSSLNVREGPGIENDVVTVVTVNQALQAEKPSDDSNWVRVSADEFTGYVNGKYLSSSKVEVKAEEEPPAKEKENKKNSVASEKKESTVAVKKEETQTTEEKKVKTKEPESTPAKNNAQKLKTVSNNNQLILVTASGYGTSSAKVETFERNNEGNWERVLSVSGHIGKNGFATKMAEGAGKSPRGKYTIGTAFGRNGNPGTKIPFRNITTDDVWVDDPESSLYNTWQSKKETQGQWSSAENMNIQPYNYGFVINYNTNQTPGAGSAIFFHVANSYTLGCTGVSQANVVSILKWLDPAKNPVIIQTPINELANY